MKPQSNNTVKCHLASSSLTELFPERRNHNPDCMLLLLVFLHQHSLDPCLICFNSVDGQLSVYKPLTPLKKKKKSLMDAGATTRTGVELCDRSRIGNSRNKPLDWFSCLWHCQLPGMEHSAKSTILISPELSRLTKEEKMVSVYVCHWKLLWYMYRINCF